MSFVCPECRGASLEIGPRMQLPSDSRSDDIAVQVVQCARCDFRVRRRGPAAEKPKSV